jgi:hypothetical protein
VTIEWPIVARVGMHGICVREHTDGSRTVGGVLTHRASSREFIPDIDGRPNDPETIQAIKRAAVALKDSNLGAKVIMQIWARRKRPLP